MPGIMDEHGPIPEPAEPERGTGTAPRRYSVPEVAGLLGISERAVRERITAGTLTAEKVEGAWQVELDAVPEAVRPEPQVPPIGTAGGTGTAALEAENAALRDERDWLRDRVEELTLTNLALISRLPAGDRPGTEAMEASLSAPEATGEAEGPADDAGVVASRWRRFWARWWHGDRE
jgi:hypothetical protein